MEDRAGRCNDCLCYLITVFNLTRRDKRSGFDTHHKNSARGGQVVCRICGVGGRGRKRKTWKRSWKL